MFVHRLRRAGILNIVLIFLVILGFAHVFENVTKTFLLIDQPIVLNIDSGNETLQQKLTINGSSFLSNMKQRHCIFPNVIERSMSTDDVDRITLILHSSYERINNGVLKQVDNWDGPISLAIVFPENIKTNSSEVQCVTKMLNIFQNNHIGANNKLSVHFLLQNQGKQCFKMDIPKAFETNLNKATCVFNRLPITLDQKIEQMASYAVNDARNLARNMSSTNYILIADMDHFFSKNFEAKMLGAAKKYLNSDPKIALVYRIFEVDENVTAFPENKNELQRMIRLNKAQEFHRIIRAHNIPKLQEWFDAQDYGNNTTAIQFFREYDYFYLEPQFVSVSSIPYHDAYFPYPSRDNTVLRWEMCRAGYKFAIMHDVFMFHPGIKTKTANKVIDKVRQKVLRTAHYALSLFNQRMAKDYPMTANKCPKFDRL